MSRLVLLHAAAAWEATAPVSCSRLAEGDVAAPSFVHSVKSCGWIVGVGEGEAGREGVGEAEAPEVRVGEGVAVAEVGQDTEAMSTLPAAPPLPVAPPPTYVTVPKDTPRPVLT